MHAPEIIITTITVSAWCTLHSMLVSRRATKMVEQLGGVYLGGYRIFYNIFSIVSLVPVITFTTTARQDIIFAWHGPWQILQIALISYALLIFFKSARSYDAAIFFGIRQWQSYRTGRRQSTDKLNTNGILRVVRHPWYSGGMALIWAAGPVTDVNLASRLIFTIYLIIGAKLEERKMALTFGEKFQQYQQNVPMFIPYADKLFSKKKE